MSEYYSPEVSRRIAVTGRQKFNGQVDVTRFVFCCLACPWQIQGGPRARSDMGGGQALAVAFAQAHLEHIAEAHPDGSDIAVVWDDETEDHPAASENKGALMATVLPRWWVEKS